MPIHTKVKSHSYSEHYYMDKFNEKRIQLSNQLELNPNDVLIRQQITFINKVLSNKTDELGLGKSIN